MPTEDTVTRPRQKDSLDELLANFEFVRIKEYVESGVAVRQPRFR